MTETDQRGVGTGSTPREAVRALVPSVEEDHVAWIEGVHAVPDESDPPSDVVHRRFEVTILFEDRSPKQWNIFLEETESGWRAVFVGSKKI